MSDIAFDIIELIFFPKELCDLLSLLIVRPHHRRFISYSSEGDEISLLLDERTLMSFAGKQKLSLILPERWIPIKRVKKHGFCTLFVVLSPNLHLAEIGVVSALSAPLRDVSILYLSTYASANILVRREDLQFCVEKLRESHFNISFSPTS